MTRTGLPTRRHALALPAGLAAALSTVSSRGEEAPASRRTAHGFSFEALEGGTIRLADFAGKVVLVVNTASRCGYTPQYKDLQALWIANRARGLVVLGIPSNDFGGQEPGSEADIKAFCTADYGVTFPMTAKQQVTGPQAHPFYRWASTDRRAVPRWNFHKILIGRDGLLAGAFDSPVRPGDPLIANAIAAALAASLR